MKHNTKLIVIMSLMFGLFMIWYGNAVAPIEHLEFYTGFGFIFTLLSGAIALTDYQDRKG
jgi:hypothetical protein